VKTVVLAEARRDEVVQSNQRAPVSEDTADRTGSAPLIDESEEMPYSSGGRRTAAALAVRVA